MTVRDCLAVMGSKTYDTSISENLNLVLEELNDFFKLKLEVQGTWSSWRSMTMTSSGHPDYEGEDSCPVPSTRLQGYRARARLLPSLPGEV